MPLLKSFATVPTACREFHYSLNGPWVQVWVQLQKEKWLPISRKRYQIGHLDFSSSRLLTETLEVRILPGEPTSLCCNWLRMTLFPSIKT